MNYFVFFLLIISFRLQAQDLDEALKSRRISEKKASKNNFSILPHRPNYILPITYAKPNEQPFTNQLQGHHLDSLEAKFQISLKYIIADDLFTKDLDLEFAYTATSWWQVYNSEISAPFRETNYQPELIFAYSKEWSLFGLAVKKSSISFNHQSNGQAGSVSRSWNRVIGGLTFGRDRFIWSLEAWWRLPEDKKITPTSIKGDNNPDITDYLGHGMLGLLWLLPRDHIIEIGLRNNLKTTNNHGSIEIGWSFPFTGSLRGYVQGFSGYGEDLVGYNLTTERIGIGIKLTDWL